MHLTMSHFDFHTSTYELIEVYRTQISSRTSHIYVVLIAAMRSENMLVTRHDLKSHREEDPRRATE